jgi:hypothetical protein
VGHAGKGVYLGAVLFAGPTASGKSVRRFRAPIEM